MKRLLTAISIFIVLTMTLQPVVSFQYGPYGAPPATIRVDKTVYSPGEAVRVIIDFPSIAQENMSPIHYTADITVVEGVTSQHAILHLSKPVEQNPTIIEFELPNQDPTNKSYQYLIMASVNGDDLKSYGWSLIPVSTVAGGDKVAVSDLKVDKKMVNPGDSLDVSYKVKDGTGALVPLGHTGIGLCDSKLKEPIPGNAAITPSIIARENQSASSYYGCHFLYSGIASPSGTFNVKLKLPSDMPSGSYFLNAWTYAWPFSGEPAASTEVTVGELKPSKESPIIAQAVSMINDTSYTDKLYPQFYSDYRFVTPGEVLAFYGFQFGNPGGADILGENPEIPYWIDESHLVHTPGVPDVNVNIKIVAPGGAVVFDKSVLTNADGSFRKITFPITQNMEQGLYLVYYNATMPDGTYVHYNWDDSDNVDWFYVSRIQSFTIEAEGKEYKVVLQGVGINASHIVFDKESKTISLDIQRIEGNYGYKQFINSIGSTECPFLYIEEPLLTGPFSAALNDDSISSCGNPLWNSAGQMVIGPLSQSGKLTIQGTYVIPEFGPLAFISLVLGLIGGILLRRLRSRLWQDGQ